MGSSKRPSTIDGILDIALHHARDIHNICIYGNQDVYAKFCITQTQDAIYSTQPIRGGGKNPVFNQSLQILISKLDAVLKCEIWMMSCLRTYLEDQLLGFVLVPLCDLFGQGKVTKDFSLSSTELFHTPAGTICMSLTYYLRGADMPFYGVPPHTPSVSGLNAIHGLDDSETHAHDMISDDSHDFAMNINPSEYNNIEFPDVQAVCENQRLVSVYLNMASSTDTSMHEDTRCEEKAHDEVRTCVNEGGASFLQLGSSMMKDVGSEMSIHSSGDTRALVGSRALSVLQEDVDITLSVSPVDMKGKEVQFLDSLCPSTHELPALSAQKSIDSKASLSTPCMTEGESKAQFVGLSSEPEEPIIQQQIVGMYMRSMHQFSESLAKMKLPLDADEAHSHSESLEKLKLPLDLEEAPSHEQLKRESLEEKEGPNADTKDSHKVFYGSRAFF